MDTTTKDVVFFDFAGTLGQAVLSSDGSRPLRFDVYASTEKLLSHLRGTTRLGMLAFGERPTNQGLQGLLATDSVDPLFESGLIETQPVLATTHFIALANRAGVPAQHCLFVSRDANRRSVAVDAQFRVAPAAKYVTAVLAGEKLTYVRLRPHGAPDTSRMPLLSIPGFELLEPGNTGATSYGFATESAKREVRHAGFDVEDLMSPEAAAVTRLFIIRDGLDADFVRKVREQLTIVEETPAGLIVGLPPDRSISEFHPKQTAHGHTALIPFVAPLPPPADPTVGDELSPASGVAMAPADTAVVTPCNPLTLPVATLSIGDASLLSQLDGTLVQQFLDPLVGVTELKLAGNILITSRAAENAVANQQAVDHLAAELQDILGNSSTVPFACDLGSRLNVLAEITGSQCPKSVIIIGAHLDSTASSTGGWDKTTDAAPGADDDASGVAGVLAAAKVLAKLGVPRRTIRFMLFNGEEIGMLGSGAYAQYLNDYSQDKVVAMIQMDMIGHRNAAVPERRVELHPPGTGDFNTLWPQVIAKSQAVANAIAAVAAIVSPNLEVQQYPIAPCTIDPVSRRSDHSSFLVAQMAACAVSEELFGDSCATYDAHSHPGYHTVHDTMDIIDTDYIADIARAVAAAAWVIANG